MNTVLSSCHLSLKDSCLIVGLHVQIQVSSWQKPQERIMWSEMYSNKYITV